MHKSKTVAEHINYDSVNCSFAKFDIVLLLKGKERKGITDPEAYNPVCMCVNFQIYSTTTNAYII